MQRFAVSYLTLPALFSDVPACIVAVSKTKADYDAYCLSVDASLPTGSNDISFDETEEDLESAPPVRVLRLRALAS